jgi:hypothetical protein
MSIEARSWRWSRGLGLAALVGCVACGGGSSASTAGAGGAGQGGGGAGGAGASGPAPVACDEPSELDLEGTWAAFGRLRVSMTGAPGGAITICPEDQVAEATLFLLVSFAHDAADRAVLTDVRPILCSVELPVVTALVGACDPASPSLVSAQIKAPEALIASLPEVATASVGGALGGLAAGAALDLDRLVVTVGATSSTLPDWDMVTPSCSTTDVGRTNVCADACVSDCAGLRDDDADGYPGVTLDVCGLTPKDLSDGLVCNAADPAEAGTTIQGRAFLSLEVDPKLTGEVVSSCEIEGTVDTGVTYSIVGGDIFLAGAPIGVTSAIKSLPVFDVDAGESVFRMVRIDGRFGAPDFGVDVGQDAIAACAEALSRKNELF